MPEERKFEPEITLSQQEIQDLAGIVHHPGFVVIQRICLSIVDQFTRNCINQNTEAEILSSHKSAKVAAQLYTMLIGRINQEVSDFVGNIKHGQSLVDSGEALDIGEFIGIAGMEEEPF